MIVGTRLFTWLYGERVGSDTTGNRYFRNRNRKRRRGRRERRWVIYSGQIEASKVPPEWHGWLHHTTDTVPPEGGGDRKPWQKDHLPNQTGSPAAYRPPGHVLSGARRDRATGDYEPWRPG